LGMTAMVGAVSVSGKSLPDPQPTSNSRGIMHSENLSE